MRDLRDLVDATGAVDAVGVTQALSAALAAAVARDDADRRKWARALRGGEGPPDCVTLAARAWLAQAPVGAETEWPAEAGRLYQVLCLLPRP